MTYEPPTCQPPFFHVGHGWGACPMERAAFGPPEPAEDAE